MHPDVAQAVPVVVVSVERPLVSIEVETNDVRVECLAQAVTVHAEENVVNVLPLACMGGGSAASDVLVRPCVGAVHGHRAVMIADGAFRHPDLAQAAHADAVIGIAEQSGAAGDEIAARMRGLIRESSWSWSPGSIWCGADGVLTQAPPPTGWLLVVGRAVDATTIDVDIDTPFHRVS